MNATPSTGHMLFEPHFMDQADPRPDLKRKKIKPPLHGENAEQFVTIFSPSQELRKCLLEIKYTQCPLNNSLEKANSSQRITNVFEEVKTIPGNKRPFP